MTEQVAVVIGASSGIGAAVARRLGELGYAVGLAARRRARLKRVARDIDGTTAITTMDVRATEGARAAFFDLVDRLGGIDLLVISAGVGGKNPTLAWPDEQTTIDTNVRGFAALATAAVEALEEDAGETDRR